jgi:hypothetical protein
MPNQYDGDLMERLAHDMGPCLHVSGLGMPFLLYEKSSALTCG